MLLETVDLQGAMASSLVVPLLVQPLTTAPYAAACGSAPPR